MAWPTTLSATKRNAGFSIRNRRTDKPEGSDGDRQERRSGPRWRVVEAPPLDQAHVLEKAPEGRKEVGAEGGGVGARALNVAPAGLYGKAAAIDIASGKLL